MKHHRTAALVAALSLPLGACSLLAKGGALGGAPRAPDGPPPPVATEGGALTRAYDHLPPYLDAPSDPWTSVVGDQPRRLSATAAEGWVVRSTDFACTAVHDHCVTPETWLLESDVDARRAPAGHGTAVAFGLGPDGPVVPTNVQRSAGLPAEPYTAYRTVPATRKNLATGALVAVIPFPETHLHRGGEVFTTTWYLGTVTRVDWDLGLVYLAGRDQAYWLSGARTAVLAWRPGGPVEVLGGRPRDALAVRADEVVSPEPAAP